MFLEIHLSSQAKSPICLLSSLPWLIWLIIMAFEHIKISNDTHFTIFFDCLSCLQSLHNVNIEHPYILSTLCNYLHASRQGEKDGQFLLDSEPHWNSCQYKKPLGLQNAQASLKL